MLILTQTITESCQQNGLREAELTDWKDNRYFRIMALDHGILSWTDVQYHVSSTWPVTLVTWPPRVDTVAGDREPLYKLISSTHVRMLVFSDIKIMEVTVRMEDGVLLDCDLQSGPLWTCPWRPGNYARGSRVMVVEVEDEFGEIHVTRHVFNLEGGGGAQLGLGRIVLALNMIEFFQVKDPENRSKKEHISIPVYVLCSDSLLCRIFVPGTDEAQRSPSGLPQVSSSGSV